MQDITSHGVASCYVKGNDTISGLDGGREERRNELSCHFGADSLTHARGLEPMGEIEAIRHLKNLSTQEDMSHFPLMTKCLSSTSLSIPRSVEMVCEADSGAIMKYSSSPHVSWFLKHRDGTSLRPRL